ncbi:MAG TPA: hypothetical protein VEP48_01180 [Methylomirabilota bacterium]|nr:hypothetical protein [Methylomirabilota bacterium]
MRDLGPSFVLMQPWQRAGVTHEEWVAARLQAAALLRAVENGDPEAVTFVRTRPDRSEIGPS